MNSNASQEPVQSGSQGGQPSRSDPRARLNPPGEYISLIVRMWGRSGEEAGAAEAGWRVEVEHIQSGGHWDFSSLNELERFLIDFLKQARKQL